MYLKRLELQGFKSFPEKIRLEFNKGITAVVGPNGSGKSNISDAVRWVLGEQSAKSLRGTKMEDVIFAGTANRRALGFAEVALVIDNSSGKFPLDYLEIIITRRVYRTGESEYQINGTVCRLKDVHELFMDTGIGREGYSIIGQGRIDEILSTKSEDRRLLFEEAAGIVKYKNRRQETYSKLEKEKQNLTRVNDIIIELENQIEPLSEQSEKAKKYLSMIERLKLLHINIFLNEADEFEIELTKLNNIISDCEVQTEGEEKAENRYKADLSDENEHQSRLERSMEICSEEISMLQLEAEKMENEIKLTNQNTEHLEQNIKRFETEVRQKENTIKSGLETRDIYLTKLNSRQLELKTVTENLESRQMEMDKLNVSLSANEQMIEQYNSDIIENMKKATEISGNLNRTIFIMEQLLNRQSELDDESDFNKNQLNEKNVRMQVLKKQANEINETYHNLQSELSLCIKQKEYINIEIKMLENEKVGLTKKNNEQSSRLKLLNEFQNNFEGYYKSVKSILKRKKSEPEKFTGIHGIVGELINVPEKYETAIEIALSGTIQNIVTTDEETAKEAIEYLKQINGGRATFLPITSVKPRENVIKESIMLENGVIGVATSLIGYQSVYSGIMSSLLGRVLVFDNIDNAIVFSKKYGYSYKIVTLEGELINVGGALTGGSTAKSSNNLFSRGREITALNSEIKMLLEEIIIINQKSEEKLKLFQETNEKIESISESIQDIRLNITEHNGRIEQLKNEIDIMLSKQGYQETEHVQLKCQIEIIESEKAEYIEHKEKIEYEIEAIKNSLEKYQSHLQEGKEESRQRINELTELRVHISSIEQEIKSINENIIRIEQENESLKKAIEFINEETASARGKIEANELKNKKTRETINKLKDKQERKSKLYSDLSRDKEKSREKVIIIQKKIEEKNNLIAELKKEQIRLELKKEQLEVENRRKYDYMWEEYELTYQMAKKYERLELSNTQMQKEEKDVKNAIKELGNVNLSAVDEYKAVKERYDFLAKQRGDILSAEEKLDGIIHELTTLMEKQFLEQFKTISHNFNMVFSEMFGGGSAHLVLCEEDRILDSGIEIIAQPPGKTLKNMMLLSGGERALTAIALLFAILHMKPSPFCILDEIEAALDDANVTRFANYLRDFSEDTQFIVITHRKGTMECADAIYGVTMQEQGVSKLVSVKFIEEAV